MSKFLLLFIISVSSIFSQSFNRLNLFPYKVGDTWDYSTDIGPERQIIYKDSIDTEGLHHLFVSSNGYENPNSTYIIDTVNYSVYNLSAGSDWLYYKLNADSGQSWIVDTLYLQSGYNYKLAKVDTVRQVMLFGSLRYEIKTTYYNYQSDTVITSSSTPNYSETLVEGLGEYLEYYPDQGGALKSLQDCIIDGDSLYPSNATSIDNNSGKPVSFVLYQNYPNPFNPSTRIKYEIPTSSFVSLKVYDILGREIMTLVNKEQLPGNYEVDFNGGNLPSGVYLYRLTYGNLTQTKKMILEK
jgi:Secretion system C-terminal sorting domain